MPKSKFSVVAVFATGNDCGAEKGRAEDSLGLNYNRYGMERANLSFYEY